MIPRTLVPEGARLPDGEIASTRRRPSNLDERTLVPSTMEIGPIDAKSTIPLGLPLEAIAARTVVPRDINYQTIPTEETNGLPPQPTELDERISIPQGVRPPDEVPPAPRNIDEELVQPDLFQTGEVAFLTDESRGKLTLIEKINAVVSVGLHVAVICLIIFAPKIFAPHVRTSDEEDLARRQITVLLPPGALEGLKESTPKPPPGPPVRVDPRVIHRVAPTPPKPVPVPEPQPEVKRDLPTAPTPQPTTAPPTPQPKAEEPKSPLKLETPDAPQPRPNALVLPQNRSPGDAIRDAARSSGRPSAPAPINGGLGQLPGGSQGGGGGRGRGTAGAGVEMLTDDEGVNFQDYLRRVYITVKQNWFAVMPPSVQLGDQGKVSLTFKIARDGSVTAEDPQLVFGSGKEPLDRAAISSIRASNPFPPLPSQFKGPFIELRFTYFYNLPIQ